MSNKVQIGWYNLRESKVFTNYFECAAWNENVEVPAGRYEVGVHGLEFSKDYEIITTAAYTNMDGTVVSDYFGAQFCGTPISGYDTKQNAGKPAHYSERWDLGRIAMSILEDPETPWELFPEYEARYIDFLSTIDGKWHRVAGIFRKAA